jgi:hypothetical protein
MNVAIYDATVAVQMARLRMLPNSASESPMSRGGWC